jgi:hypothetical protein
LVSKDAGICKEDSEKMHTVVVWYKSDDAIEKDEDDLIEDDGKEGKDAGRRAVMGTIPKL